MRVWESRFAVKTCLLNHLAVNHLLEYAPECLTRSRKRLECHQDPNNYEATPHTFLSGLWYRAHAMLRSWVCLYLWVACMWWESSLNLQTRHLWGLHNRRTDGMLREAREQKARLVWNCEQICRTWRRICWKWSAWWGIWGRTRIFQNVRECGGHRSGAQGFAGLPVSWGDADSREVFQMLEVLRSCRGSQVRRVNSTPSLP